MNEEYLVLDEKFIVVREVLMDLGCSRLPCTRNRASSSFIIANFSDSMTENL